MTEATVFSDKIIKLCPLRSGEREERICDEEDCAWWDEYYRKCKVFSTMNSITILQSKLASVKRDQ